MERILNICINDANWANYVNNNYDNGPTSVTSVCLTLTVNQQ